MHFKSFMCMLMEKIFQMVWNYFHSDKSAQKMILQKVKKCPKMAWMSIKIKVAQSLLYEGQLLQPHFFYYWVYPSQYIQPRHLRECI